MNVKMNPEFSYCNKKIKSLFTTTTPFSYMGPHMSVSIAEVDREAACQAILFEILPSYQESEFHCQFFDSSMCSL